MELTRRHFLELSGLGGALTLLPREAWALQFLEPIKVENPLAHYPARDWETVYRDIWRYDSKFVFLCAPNDTHNCLLEAYVRNGVIVRIEPTYGYGRATDLYGNRATHRWEPRCCQKGLTMMRRFYGDRRVKAPMVRKGFLQWVEQGFPRGADGRPPGELFQRGTDEWVKVSWERALEVAAQALVNIATTYSGASGQALLRAQGYDPAMVEATRGAGTQTVKVRGGMPLLGATRIYGHYRFGNALALLDAWIRKVGPDQALGARGWDNYSWHTDLPPGHPMVTGQQTVDFDLSAAEHAGLIVVWGMNWIATKMPDSHWLTEARLKGTKVVVVSVEYSATAPKADEVLVIRPGTDAALALGLAQVLIAERRYDEAFVKRHTDLPLLVRLDTLKLLRAAEVIPEYRPAELGAFTTVLAPGQAPPASPLQDRQLVPEALRREWGDFVVWDTRRGGVAPVSRDQVGEPFDRLGLVPALEGEFTVRTVSGQEVPVAPLFGLVRRYLDENFTPDQVAEITWAPQEAIVNLAREIARNRGRTLIPVGMGPNQFFNADLKDRAIFLVAALTANIGQKGGNVGSYAGNYRAALFNGLPQYIAENPFDIEPDPARPARARLYWRGESAHYYNAGDRPLKVGTKMFTGRTHMPAPTKAVFVANSNSILGNAKGAYDVIANTLPRIELWCTSEWWWTMTCEYSDIVFPADAWHELKFPDMCASVTNPFLTVFPRTPHPRLLDTRSDIEVPAGISAVLARITGDRRFLDYWRFVHEGRVEVYLDRILAASNATRGYRFAELEQRARDGVPALMMTRTTPRQTGWEQTQESRPWYTKTGRLEFYREEDEFITLGENLLVYKEPVEATFYHPSVIVARPHPLLRPVPPDRFGIAPADFAKSDVRQVLTVVMPWADLKKTASPLVQAGYPVIYHTPKYRHGAHTTGPDTDFLAVVFGPFSDVYRRDKRTPFLAEGYADINPADAKALGIEDGDYIWVDGWAEDRPYRGWKAGDPMYKVARMMCRARYYPGTPRGVVRMWFNMYGASHGSVKAHESRPDGLAKNSLTHYQAMFRYGSHQSVTRAWLRPTLSTDSLVRKEVFGQLIGKGFLPDVHTVNGAPRESMARLAKAEDGGIGGRGLWHPAARGFRPTYENEALKRFLRGDYVQVRR
ncbi:MAG: molybdopterin-dependent oxidoreductase [Candidatus Rokubacteria bacterium]|nr:molybdopterin-dependent oxidoreductase [Candidatus Rokubacteria bacterium]